MGIYTCENILMYSMKMGDPGFMEQWLGMDLMVIMVGVIKYKYQRWATPSPGPDNMSRPSLLQQKNTEGTKCQ